MPIERALKREPDSGIVHGTRMSGLAEIQEAIGRLAPEELAQLRAWLAAYDPAQEGEWAVEARERLRQIRAGEAAAINGDEVLAEMRRIVSR